MDRASNRASNRARRRRIDRRQWRLIIALSAGNALEWFDFVIYGYFALTIAKLFFPVGNDAASLLLALVTFGAGFVARPLGAFVIGDYADRHGRKPALTVTIALMTVGTGIIAVVPTFETIGMAAPVLIVAARLLQGFSAGGEFGSATALLAERNPARRGFFTSWQFSSQAMTAVLASAAGALLVAMQSDDQFARWGWRLPFLFGLLLGPIAYYIRRRIEESAEFNSARTLRAPLKRTLTTAKTRLLVAIGLVVVATVAIYTLIFMPTFAAQKLGLSLASGYMVALVTNMAQVVVIPLTGALSDRIGRLPIARLAVVLLLVLPLPLLAWLTSAPSATRLLAFQLGVGISLAIYLGVLPALLSELFPTAIRSSGLSVSYAFAVMVFGGFAPFINAALIEWTGSLLVPCYYLIAAAAISFLALMRIGAAKAGR